MWAARTVRARGLARRGINPNPPPPPPPPAMPLLTIGPAVITHDEGNSGTTAYVFTVTRTGNLDIVSSATWAASGSGANPTAPSDFSGATSGNLTFSYSDASQTITVNIIGDVDIEQSEQFSVTLSNPVNCILGTAIAFGIVTNDDSVTPPPPPPPPIEGDAPAWVADLTKFDDYVVRLGWTGPAGGGTWSTANNFIVLPVLPGETMCPGFTAGVNIKSIPAAIDQGTEMVQTVCMIVHRNVAFPAGVTCYLPPGFYGPRSGVAYAPIGVKVNLRFVGAATAAKTWMTAGTNDGTHLDNSDVAYFIDVHGTLRFENITWRRAVYTGGNSNHSYANSSTLPGCVQFVGCEFRWAADAIKMHEAQTGNQNYAYHGGEGIMDYTWTTAGVRKDTGTAIWMYDCVVRECGGTSSGLKHGLIYALNGNALRCTKVAVIDTTAGYLGAKAGINVVYMDRCLFVNRWNTYSYGRRLDSAAKNNNANRYWGDTLLETQPGAAEVVLKDTQFVARSQQQYDKLAFGSNPANGGSITINGFTVTFVSSGPVGDQVLIGADNKATAAAFVAFMQASTNPVALAFDYGLNGSDVIISQKARPFPPAPVITKSTTPSSGITVTIGGAWTGGAQAFMYEHLRGKMPFAGGGKIPDYLVRVGLTDKGSWRGIWWNNGTPVNSSDDAAQPGYMQSFIRYTATPTSTSTFGSCTFTGSSGAWPNITTSTFTNNPWVFFDGSGSLAGNRGRFATLGAIGRARTGDPIPDPVSVVVDLAAIPASDDGQGVIAKTVAPAKKWTAATKYAQYEQVDSGGNIYARQYMSSAPAASGTTAPSGTGTGISDGAYLWDYVGPVTYYGLTYHRTSGALKIVKRAVNTVTTLASATVGSVASARIRFQCIDGALKGRLWAIGGVEPTTWVVSATDAAFIPEGYVGLIGQNSATEYVEFDNLLIESPYVGRVLHCAYAQGTVYLTNEQFLWPPYEGSGLTRLPAPYNTTDFWDASYILEDAAGNKTAVTSRATCDMRTRCLLANPIPAGYVVPATSRIYLSPHSRSFHDVRFLNSEYHNPADPNYYWNKLYRVDGTVKQPADAGFNDAFHVRYIDNCSFAYIGPSQNINGESIPILKYNSEAYVAYLNAKDNEGYLAMPPQWHAHCGWAQPAGAGNFTDVADSGNGFFGGTAPSGYRGYQGSDFTDPVTIMFSNTSHYCLPSGYRGGAANPRTYLQSFDDAGGDLPNDQVAPRPRTFIVDKDTGVLTQGGARPLTTLTTLTASMAKGSTTVTVASTAGMAIGHKIEIALANDPWGLTQSDDPVTGRIKPYSDAHIWRHVTKITGISGLVVTIADPLPDPFPGDGLTNIAVAGAAVAATPAFDRPSHFITRFEDCPTARQTWS